MVELDIFTFRKEKHDIVQHKTKAMMMNCEFAVSLETILSDGRHLEHIIKCYITDSLKNWEVIRQGK